MSEPFLGEIRMFGFNFAPRGWAFCDGTLVSIASNSALFSLLGTIYGGDGRTTFALPDLRGRYAMHQGTGAGLSNRRIGERSGSENVLLTTNQIPSHSHGATSTGKVHSGTANSQSAVNNVLSGEAGGVTAVYSNATPDADMNAGAIQTTVANAGGGQAHSNMPPYQVVNFCIALVGIFPSRS